MYPLLDWTSTNFLFFGTLAIAMVSALASGLGLCQSRWYWGFLAIVGLPVLLGQIAWRVGSPALSALGVTVSWTLLPVLAAGALTFAAMVPVHRVLEWWKRRDRAARSADAGARRQFLHQTLGLLPASAMAVAGTAMAGNDQTRIVRIPLTFPGLPSELEGLRILHLSDLHLGVGRSVGDLVQVLASLRGEPPDLIVLTGDVADKVEELGPALDAVCACAPRFGVYAALGNHEYLNDIAQMLPVYQRSSVHLLLDETVTISINGAKLALAGVDDPVFVNPTRDFYETRIAACGSEVDSADFRLLLCHRPDGFESAARHGFHLTLAGHTHGGQVGLWGRSAFERLFGIPYLWGHYRRGQSQLYTTSGFGHWFPFRLSCPAEAPLIVLRRGGQLGDARHESARV